METRDAVVIGAGPNGLVAANHLADAGWSVLVLEAQPSYGGAVASDSDVHPDFVHDTFSAFYPLAAASAAVRDLRLEEHGLVWTRAPAVLGHVFGDGGWALLHHDRATTAQGFDDPADGVAWWRLCDLWDRLGDDLVGAVTTPFPPVRHGVPLLLRVARTGGLRLVRELLTPATDLAETWFRGRQARALLLGNGGHADIPLQSPGSGLFGLLMTMLAQTVGFPVPEGGAQRLSDALVARLRSKGGEVRCGAEVERVLVRDGRAHGVRTVDGTCVAAARGVLADVVAPHLYGGLVAPEDLPARVARGMRDFRLDPGTVKVDFALSGPVPWAVRPDSMPGTVHVSPSPEALSRSLGQVAAGEVPREPFLLMGQMTTTDATRSPAGTESCWIYSHVPQRVVEDAGGVGGPIRGSWDADERERFADRMQDQVERVAPGFGSRVLARRVLGPRELEARNANLVGGAINGGTSQLHQQLVFRPVPGWGRAETGIPGLYLASASAHPGGGVHGAPGANAARAAIAHDRLRLGRRSARA
jgi:phytoene dehydrogenase-like protein